MGAGVGKTNACEPLVGAPSYLMFISRSRDILNHVYFGKKQLYLAVVADLLTRAGLCGSVQLSRLHGDPRKPHLVLQPPFKSKYSVRIFPCITATTFKLTQLKPTKNNIRPSAWKLALQKRRQSGASAATALGSDVDPSTLPPTPFYNMALLEDIAMVPQYRILSKARESCPCFRDVCILLKVRPVPGTACVPSATTLLHS